LSGAFFYAQNSRKKSFVGLALPRPAVAAFSAPLDPLAESWGREGKEEMGGQEGRKKQGEGGKGKEGNGREGRKRKK